MKNCYFLIFCIVLLFWSLNTKQSLAQGLIVNEVSNGLSGAREYMEFVVVGSSATPLAPVNLTNWIIDDNNGNFEAVGTGVGITSGHIVITGACFSAVPPGSIIVLYNASDRNPLIPPDDPTDANGDGVYILSTANACLSVCNTNPNTGDGSYLPCAGGLVPATAASWSASLSLGNAGDAIQTRRPDGTFFHGFSYGDVTAPFPTFFGGGSSFNVGPGGTGSFFFFECGGYKTSGNYNAAIAPAAPNQTPGAANTANNQIFLNEVSAGSYDYTNLTSANNCDNILPVDFWKVYALPLEQGIEVLWATASETNNSHFIVERSLNAKQFEEVSLPIQGQISSSAKHEYRFLDKDVLNNINYYYRIKQIDLDGQSTYSKLVQAICPTESEQNAVVFVTASEGQVVLDAQFEHLEPKLSFRIMNALGQIVLEQECSAASAKFQKNWPLNLSKGIYYYNLYSLQTNAKWQGKFII
ncbi:MAG: hypothetical protein EAZ57_05865 [Cytophagales bacterium]|nr:MAG: hypothetical protein EAZ67_06770 [Cytophagales bacterium]TAF60877.1 MAG: hypothetical protein EAZ57_05865 [Cytophagales bacterium]